ncbi:hypothetical protein [Anaerostipes sp.]|uniref:hypothetical protein n=1 Tax=Anaerostipes sp. TaxID=1872530 RepID=UPI0025C39CB5|nr:hypothetical protein [Anaerostipes sp.]MBS7008975.1 hypothetical protein [Anaerostipes sp.]
MINVKSSRLDRYYNIAKVLLCLTPFVCLAYLSMGAARVGGSVSAAIGEDPKLAVMFLVSMINPFIAYLISFMQKRLNMDAAYAVVNLTLLIAAEAMLQNVWYILLLGFILYKTKREYGLSVTESFRKSWKGNFLSIISGSLVVIGFCSVCLFATIRIAVQ